MKSNFLLCLSLLFSLISYSQDFNGQWKGEFTDKSTSFSGFGGDQCEYVLELECKGNSVTGSSYTYFTDAGKKYYTICRLEGKIKPKEKFVEIKEVERTKTNVPVNIRNCFQVHRLTYFKHGDSTILEGNWIPAPEQQGDCGYGTTLLSRRELKSSYPNFNSTASKSNNTKPATKKPAIAKTTTTKKEIVAKPATKQSKPVVKKPVAKNSVAAKPKASIPNSNNYALDLAKEQARKEIAKKETPVDVQQPAEQAKKDSPDSILFPKIKFEKRSNTVLQTVVVKNKTVKVDLYDNGEVDGDSISLFYNGKLLISSKRLSEKPITLNITVEDDVVNELVMYAENLGTIPPNTALMVVTDGPKRYEVRITSDLQKSGVINFVHKPS